MYLKRIELKGFKSFADKTVIDFEEGISAIVGPNGSGKSNITEALRWVLGEQSAKSLRGGKMHDIIFAGSLDRKPLNIAEVTVVLDNTDRYFAMDFSEISITRRITRSGDSDFYINKKASRLRDIQELFMDSGLGKESFSIISQGKVESIFNSKPEERRGIFEEAAGVLKYKMRKKEAQRKLLETQDNLSRLEDIVHELNEQLQPLEEQSKVAKQYQEMYKQLVKLDTSVNVALIRENKETFDQYSQTFSDLSKKLNLQEKQSAKDESRLMVKRSERTALDDKLDELNSQLLHLTQAITQAQGDERVQAQITINAQETAETHEKNLQETIEKLKILADEINQIAEEITDKEEETIQLEEEIDEEKVRLAEFSKSTKEISDELRHNQLNLASKKSAAKSDLEHLQARYEEESIHNADTILQYEQLKNQQTKALANQEKLAILLKEQTFKLKEQLDNYAHNNAQYQLVKENYTKAQASMYEVNNEISRIASRHQSLKDIQASYQGYYQGVKAVLQNKQELGGIIGSVAEVIEVQKEQALAIETALGGAMQHIIVENEEAAKRSIRLLSQKRLGRATLLPLTTIKPRQINDIQLDGLKKMNGFIDIASNLVTYPDKVQNILKNLLGLVIVADTLENATTIARTIRFQYKVVSLDGSVMNPGGSMTGGQTNRQKNSSLFTQNEEITQLEVQLSALKQKQLQIEEEVKTKLEIVQEQETNLESIRQIGENLRLEENQAKNNLANAKERLSQLEVQLTNFEQETAQLGEFLADYESRKALIEDDLHKIHEKQMWINEQLSTMELQVQKQEENKANSQEKLAQLKAKLLLAQEQYERLIARLEEKSGEQKELNAKRFEISTLLKNIENKSNEQVLSAEQIKEKVKQLEISKAKIELDITNYKEELAKLIEEIKHLEETVKASNTLYQAILKQKNEVEIKKARASDLLDNLLNYLLEEYSLSFEKAQEESLAIENIQESKNQVKQLKRSIDELGPVNIAAIEQFAQVNERFEFLTSQRDDLLEAKQSLFEVMEEMDVEVIRRFEETFQAIRQKFKQTFPSMFGGGRADLVLTDPEDLLNTGISIDAQPPGKKIQSLTQLSGGEKALTAIALLFSIIQVRTVPFVVLDEVEAALDEANVTRFGQYLAHFDEQTQFILVTHRKGTMQAADILYGVTMQESGVSKLVSVHFA
ncbi:MAG: chromosome segregation protein SMC [Streptococcaceae bacterium]|nr:chromosome segregation protein SMC [Streptococcaceae bacterium]